MYAVTGIGPRTGTSWVMYKLFEAGLPVNGHRFLPELCVTEHNPNGYWELYPGDPVPESGISKVWGIWKHDRVDRVVILKRRDREAQIRSMEKVLRDELKLEHWKHVPDQTITMNEIIETCDQKTTDWLKTAHKGEVLTVDTEDLDQSIGYIVSFLKGGKPWL